MVFNLRYYKGFTLIEVLVVISIVSFLFTSSLYYFKKARVDANDTKIVSEIKELEKALELYIIDNGVYPTFSEIVSNMPAYGNWNLLGAVLAPYISKMPYPPHPLGASWYHLYYSAPPTIYMETGGKCLTLYRGYYLTIRFENPNNKLSENDGGLNSVLYEILKGDYEILSPPCF